MVWGRGDQGIKEKQAEGDTTGHGTWKPQVERPAEKGHWAEGTQRVSRHGAGRGTEDCLRVCDFHLQTLQTSRQPTSPSTTRNHTPGYRVLDDCFQALGRRCQTGSPDTTTYTRSALAREQFLAVHRDPMYLTRQRPDRGRQSSGLCGAGPQRRGFPSVQRAQNPAWGPAGPC